MDSYNLLDEKLLTVGKVYIEDDEVYFVSLVLEQSFGEHHHFEVVLDCDLLIHSFMKDPLKQMELIGKFLYIRLIQSSESGFEYIFKGIIGEVQHEGKEGKHGYLRLRGMSPTVLLERGKRLDVFSNMDFRTIVDEVTDGITNKNQWLPTYSHPVYEEKIDFLMQYYESDWEFLRRLSAISGETLFYTGLELVFGKYKDWDPIVVTYDLEITDFKFGGRMMANDFVRYQYLPDKDETLIGNAPDSVEGSNEYIDSVMKATQRIKLSGDRLATIPVSLPVKNIGSLNELLEREKVSTAARTVYISGTSKTFGPLIGRFLTINMPDNIADAKELGTFRITKVKHIIDDRERYTCEFEGIPGGLKFVPTPDIKPPVTDSLIATVVDNNDPQGQGRIKVDFPFAKDRSMDTWLRVMTPDAGSGDEKGAKNRGMVFIPEINSEVIVGFEFGDPNRPYVQGSLFTGASGGGGGVDNASKSLITRCGNTIIMNDAKRSITIKDPSGNVITTDGKGNVSITAPESIKLNVGNNTLTIKKDGETKIATSKEFKVEVGESTLSITPNTIKIKSGNNNIVGTNHITGGDTKIDGGNVFVN